MKIIVSIVAATLLLASIACAATEQKVNLKANAITLEDTMKQISSQAGVSIVVDPKAKGTVTLSLSDMELTKALDAITKLNNLSWKKFMFAKSDDTLVKLDQMKSTLVALSSIPMVAMCVEDPATKTNIIFAKDTASSPDTSSMSLPKGYSWATVYVILAKDSFNDTTAQAKNDDKVKSISEVQNKLAMEIANMTPEERQQVYTNEITSMLNYTPEARQQMMQDRMQAFRNLDPSVKEQLRAGMPHFGGRHNQDNND